MEKSDTIKAIFGQRVKEPRTKSGMSQETFADKCRLARTYVSGIERDVRNPTLEVMNVIAQGLGVE